MQKFPEHRMVLGGGIAENIALAEDATVSSACIRRAAGLPIDLSDPRAQMITFTTASAEPRESAFIASQVEKIRRKGS